MDNKNNLYRFPIHLFISLMAMSFLPFLYQIVRIHLISDIQSIEGLSIIGHLEWFDLFAETINAFLIVPLYSIFNKAFQDRGMFQKRINTFFWLVMGVYFVFSLVIYFSCSKITDIMVNKNGEIVAEYLKLEMFRFFLENIVSFAAVVFVVIGKSKYIYQIIFGKIAALIVSDLIFIPLFSVYGVAYSGIVVNAVIILVCLIDLRKEGISVKAPVKMTRQELLEYSRIGLFSGMQIFLDNIVYILLVCRMVNRVEEQGNYWAANNFIWGLLLIPISAVGEIIKRDCKEEKIDKNLKAYFAVLGGTIVFWSMLVPFFKEILYYGMGIYNSDTIKSILFILVPFYIFYGIFQIFDSIFIGYGKTQYIFIISVIINLVYYPLVYIFAFIKSIKLDIVFICHMFGMGMLLHMIISCCIYFFRYKGEVNM